MAKWTWILFEGAKAHGVPLCLTKDLIDDLARRRHPVVKRKDLKRLEEIAIDLPGMILTTRPYENFRFADLRLVIPSEDVGIFADRLEALNERVFPSGRRYYKLHAFWRALTMTPAQRDALLAALRNREAAADARHETFFQAYRNGNYTPADGKEPAVRKPAQKKTPPNDDGLGVK